MPAKYNRHPPKDHDGLTAKEAAFVRERKQDPAAPGAKIARRAGYKGTEHKLRTRAAELMRVPRVAAALFAPVAPPKPGAVPPTDEQIKQEVRAKWLAILRSKRTSDSDKIKAGDKLMATVKGGFVPVEIKNEGSMTLEHWVRAMGGAPEEREINLPALPGRGADA